MGEVNKVTVRIYGQEYTISGDDSREQIIKIADYVDVKMKELQSMGGPVSSVAVLTALNITGDYFAKAAAEEKLLAENARLQEENQNFNRLWDDTKRSFAQYKQEVASAGQQRELIQRQYMEKEQQYLEKDQQLNTLTTELAETRKRNDVLRAKIDELARAAEEQNRIIEEKNRIIETLKSAPADSDQEMKDLEAKCRDIESSFFDIQMENIRLKNELEAVRRQR